MTIRRKILLGCGAAALAALLSGLGGYAVQERVFRIPDALLARVPKELPPADVREAAKGEARSSGRSWLRKERGIWKMYLEGDPFTVGYTAARLTDPMMENLENDFLGMIKEKVPSSALLWLLKKYVILRLRDLPDFISEEYKLEILGAAKGFTDRHPGIAPLYHRLGAYHAAHDISHFVMDMPLAPKEPIDGCTAFSARGPGGHLLTARNFDFQGGPGFDRDKIVMFVKPEKGYPFISVSWPGMLGAVTGMNARLIYVSINAGASSDTRAVGTPSCFVVREVLQRAATIEEAVAIISRAQVFVSDSFLVADGKTGRAIVVEKTPARMGIRKTEGERIVCANHFITKELAGDPKNLKYMASSSSVARQKRAEALLALLPKGPDIFSAAAILRDRGEGRKDAEGADPMAINTLVATHSIVADVTDGILWVSAGPHQEGEYVPFSVKDFASSPAKPRVPVDPFFWDGRYERYVKAHGPAGY